MSTTVRLVCVSALVLCAGSTVAVVAAPPIAFDDAYETTAANNLSVDAPGVLENDTDADGDPLTAILVTDPVSGGVVNLFTDGSFEYEPPPAFLGLDSFTYRAFDGTDVSNIATVTVTVTGDPQLATYLDEAAFLADLTALGFDATVESFEEDAIWGTVRSTISGGSFTAPAITGMGVRWTSNNDTSEITTGNGPARSGSWGFYCLPHGNFATGVNCDLPGVCGDGFRGTTAVTLYGVGGWISGTFGSTIEITLDGVRIVDFGNDAGVGAAHKFFGVIDPGGFHSYEFQELEGKAEDQKFIFADDFTFGTPAGITLTALRGPGPSEVTLQWLGGQPTFSVFRSADPEDVALPINELGQTSGRVWADVPPPGSIFFFQVN